MPDHLPELSSPYALDPGELARYRADGHARLRRVCTAAEVAAYRPLIRDCWSANRLNDRPMSERDTYGRAFTQALNLGLRDPRIFRFAYAGRFARLAADLMGVPRVRMFLDEAFFKEPGSGPTPWHQDQPTWPFDAERAVTLWIPLTDVTVEMGALTFATGSHHHRQIVADDISDESDAALGRFVAEHSCPCISYGVLPVGDVTAHDGWTVHRAGPNRTDAPREVYAMHYFADGARVVEPDNETRRRILKHFGPGLRAGDAAASEHWRLVYPTVDPLQRTL